MTAKRRATVALAFEHAAGARALFDVVVGSDDTERHKPDPDRSSTRSTRSSAEPATPPTSATRRSTSARRRRRACTPSPSRGAGSTREERLRGRGAGRASCTRRRSSLMPSEHDGAAPRRRAARARSTTTSTATTSSTSPRSRTPSYDRLFDELKRAGGGAPGARDRRLADAARRSAAVGALPQGRHVAPMGSLEKVTTDEALLQVGATTSASGSTRTSRSPT